MVSKSKVVSFEREEMKTMGNILVNGESLKQVEEIENSMNERRRLALHHVVLIPM